MPEVERAAAAVFYCWSVCVCRYVCVGRCVLVGVYGAWCQSLAALQTDGCDGKGQIMNKEKEEMMSTDFEGNKET